MFKTIQNIAAGFFIASVAVLTILAVLAVWDFLAEDVITKSLTTIGILGFSSLVIIIAARALDNRQGGNNHPTLTN
ncbi:MAG TPA: hypothetical protein VI752_00575 [Candidatus Paceibacterota bacterium]